MLHKFLPREFNFFNQFEQQADRNIQVAFSPAHFLAGLRLHLNDLRHGLLPSRSPGFAIWAR